MERLPISEREILIRYGRFAPNARDRILDQFYLLIPSCSSLRQYTITQAVIFGSAFFSLGLALFAVYLITNQTFHWSQISFAFVVSGFILLFEAVLLYYVSRRRAAYAKRYHEKLMQPTDIGLSPERINVHHRIIHGGCIVQSIRWDEVSSVRIEEGPEVAVLKLSDHSNRAIELQIDHIQTIEERQLLRDFLLHYVKQIDIRSTMNSLLRIGKRDDVPFTKLWCQALQDSRPRVHTRTLPRETILQDGKFIVHGSIGGGGQGNVYSATMNDLEGDHRVVLKEYVLPDVEHGAEHKAACEQFEKEIRLLSLADHPGVIKLIDAFVEDHRAYLVLENVDGYSLKNNVEKKGPFLDADLVALAMQMCDILGHLHSMSPSIMHLDFSPENILLSGDRVILIDFNISVEENAMRTRTVMGKQRYMAPEQYRGTPSCASDIYALGATLFFLLTAREPEPITVSRPIRFNSEIDPRLDSIIAKCTALEKEERYSSIGSVKEELSSLDIARKEVN